MTNNRAHQNAVLQFVVDRFNAASGAKYVITRHPDEEERVGRACDGYAEASGETPIAIEHTLVQTHSAQKQTDAEFVRVIGVLEEALKDQIPFRLTLTVPQFAVKKGQDWESITEAIKVWLLAGPAIPPGNSQVTIPDVPFPIRLRRDDIAPPRFLVGRWEDSSLDLERELVGMMVAAITDKNDQLARYKQAGDHAILVLESDDITFTNRADLYRAFLEAWDRCTPTSIDQVWLATTIPQEFVTEIYCLHADQDLLDRVNPETARFGSKYRDEWVVTM
jgi:hypothetical protein